MVEMKTLRGAKVRATFALPSIEGADSLFLVGDFNDWSETATPMARRPDGSWAVAVDLAAGRAYQYRFRDDKGRWHDDPAASARAPNAFGGANSVLDVPEQRKAAKPPKRKV
jgi:1,4-alpha-glucan branching enzyme